MPERLAIMMDLPGGIKYTTRSGWDGLVKSVL